MSTSTLTKTLLKLSAARGAPKRTKSELFDAFIKSAAPQIRTAFISRHDDEEIFDLLNEFFVLTQTRTTDMPLVEVTVSETGIKKEMGVCNWTVLDTAPNRTLLDIKLEGYKFSGRQNLPCKLHITYR